MRPIKKKTQNDHFREKKAILAPSPIPLKLPRVQIIFKSLIRMYTGDLASLKENVVVIFEQ